MLYEKETTNGFKQVTRGVEHNKADLAHVKLYSAASFCVALVAIGSKISVAIRRVALIFLFCEV